MKKLIIEDCECINISNIIYHLKYDKRSSRRSIADELSRLSRKSLTNEFAGVPRFRLFFTTTKCSFGGYRWWLLCPYCNRMVGKLYTPLSTNEFKCRHCHNLTYESSQNHSQRVDTLAKQLVEIHEKDGKEKFLQIVQKIQRTRRGKKLLAKVYDRMIAHYPSPFLARRDKEQKCYEKYIKLLFEV